MMIDGEPIQEDDIPPDRGHLRNIYTVSDWLSSVLLRRLPEIIYKMFHVKNCYFQGM